MRKNNSKKKSRFKSRLGHTESRSSSGSPNFGQEGGQESVHELPESDNFILATLTSVMESNNPSPLPYKEAFVSSGKDLYASLSYWSFRENKYLRKKIRVNDKTLTREQKEKLLQDFCDKINPKLRERNKHRIYHEQSAKGKLEKEKHNYIADILATAMDDRLTSDNRKVEYRRLKGKILLFLEENAKYSNYTLSQINDEFLLDFIDWMQSQELAGKTINLHLNSINALSEWAVAKGIIQLPVTTTLYRVKQPKNQTGRFPPLTEEQKLKVFSYYKRVNHYYYLFLLFIYYPCFRNQEIHRLQRRHLILDRRLIFAEWLNTKNGLSNYVQMLDAFYNAIMDSHIPSLSPDMYLFGENFKPTKEKYVGKSSSEYWADNRKAIGLDPNISAYGLKHTFNIDYVENNKYNLNWEWLRRHNRHATVPQTQEYISGLTAYFLDETQAIIKDYTNPE